MSTAVSPPASDARLTVVVMGVSGSGKTTLGRDLARVLGITFIDGDDLHPNANVAKMSAGIPLTDEDRWPWLDRVGSTLADRHDYPAGAVVACSALRHVYRDRIRSAAGSRVFFVHLDAEEADMQERLEARPGHFMPATLVKSQFATLELPVGEPDVLVLPARDLPDDNATQAARWLSRTVATPH